MTAMNARTVAHIERLLFGSPLDQLARAAERVRRRTPATSQRLVAALPLTSHCRHDCRFCAWSAARTEAPRHRLNLDETVRAARMWSGRGATALVLLAGDDEALSPKAAALLAVAVRQATGLEIFLGLCAGAKTPGRVCSPAGFGGVFLRHTPALNESFALLRPGQDRRERLRRIHTLKRRGLRLAMELCVGSPGQTPRDLAADVALVHAVRPFLCDVTSFVPQPNSPFADKDAGNPETALRVSAALRLLMPDIQLPAAWPDRPGWSRPHDALAPPAAGGLAFLDSLTPDRSRSRLFVGRGASDRRSQFSGPRPARRAGSAGQDKEAVHA